MPLDCSPTGRLTYRQLAHYILDMDDDQLDFDVTVEDGDEDECYAAELRICGSDHHTGNGSLDEFHPVIFLRRGDIV